MDLPDRAEARSWQGRDVVDRDGQPLGRCHGVFADTETGLPEWVLVDAQDRRAFVPAGDADADDDRVRVQFAREQVLAAPDVGDVTQLTEEDEKLLYTHYGVAFSTRESDSVLPIGATDAAGTDAAATVAADDEAADFRTATAPAAAAQPAASSGAVTATPPADSPASSAERSSAAPPAAWAPRTVPESGGGSAAGTPLAAVAGLVAVVWLGLRERDRRAARRRSASARTRGLRSQLSAASAVVGGLTQQAAGVTSAAAASAAASTADATRAGRSASRSAARAAARTSAASSRRAAKQRKRLSRKAARTGGAVTGSARQLAHAATGAASGAGEAVTDSTRQLGSAVTAAGAALTDSSRSLVETAARVPRRAARRGRKVRRSVGRLLWDAVLATAAGAGYVAGARAGRERYDEIAAFAAQTAERPEVRRVTETVTTAVTDPERRAEAADALLEAVRPHNG